MRSGGGFFKNNVGGWMRRMQDTGYGIQDTGYRMLDDRNTDDTDNADDTDLG